MLPLHANLVPSTLRVCPSCCQWGTPYDYRKCRSGVELGQIQSPPTDPDPWLSRSIWSSLTERWRVVYCGRILTTVNVVPILFLLYSRPLFHSFSNTRSLLWILYWIWETCWHQLSTNINHYSVYGILFSIIKFGITLWGVIHNQTVSAFTWVLGEDCASP